MIMASRPTCLTGTSSGWSSPLSRATRGPHWTRYFAPEETVGGFPSQVEPGTVNDPASKKTRQVDVVALGPADDRQTVLAIGEVK